MTYIALGDAPKGARPAICAMLTKTQICRYANICVHMSIDIHVHVDTRDMGRHKIPQNTIQPSLTQVLVTTSIVVIASKMQ